MVTSRMVPGWPALVVKGSQSSLVVSDLHIGFEDGLAANKISVGKNSTTRQTVSDISAIIETARPDSLVLLGDIKSGTGAISKSEWSDVPFFFEEISKVADIIMVPGNHDAGISRLVPGSVTVSGPQGIVIDGTLFTHGHARISESFADIDRIVMGHLHPVFIQEGSVLDGSRVWITMTVSKSDIFPSSDGSIEITIMPAWNRYFYASGRRHKKSISPLAARIREIISARILTLDGSIIGNESTVRDYI